MLGDFLNVIKALAKGLFGFINWLIQFDLVVYQSNSNGPQLGNRRRLILCFVWGVGAFVGMLHGPIMNALVAGMTAVGVSFLLLIVWDDAPKVVCGLMWSGAAIGLATAVVVAVRVLAHAFAL